LCALRDVADDPGAALASTGATTIVCLNQRAELERRAPTYLEWIEAHREVQSLWFPIRNFHAESADATMPLLQLVVDRLERGEGVIMHCAMGQGRAGTMAVCLLMLLGSTRDHALRTVAEHRVFAGPGEWSQWALVDDVARSMGA
jgi:protein-tyrosine phosphatase